MTYKEANALFKKSRDKERGYRISDNTRLHKRGNAFAVRFHTTDIVMIRPDGTYRLNTGGWRTPTTKKRINMIIPHHLIIQKNGIWYAGNIYYTDRMLIRPETKNCDETELFINIQKIKTRVDHKVRKFIELLTERCIEQDIRAWESYRKYTVPRPDSKAHLKKLWKTINIAPNSYNDPNIDSQLIHMATLARGYDDPQCIWAIIREELLRETQRLNWITDILKTFMRPRKPLIAEMIATGELE